MTIELLKMEADNPKTNPKILKRDIDSAHTKAVTLVEVLKDLAETSIVEIPV